MRRAARLADEVLAPAAADVDLAALVPRRHLDLLADEGLYALGGPGVEPRTRWLTTEILAAGCLATTFVWLQHHGAVRTVSGSRLADAWLPRLLSGEVRAGIAIAGVRGPRPSLRARREAGRWLLDGDVPWTTGWGLIDVVLAGAATCDGREVWCLLDAVETETLTVEPVHLVAANASGTVRPTLRAHAVDESRVVDVHAAVPAPPHDGGGRGNGSLALGVARRACAMMGPSPLDDELTGCRARLDAADELQMAGARAAASELALRATARLAVVAGASSVVAGGPVERLRREAHLTAVFGSRPAVKRQLTGLLDR